jgi:hypothetical protein
MAPSVYYFYDKDKDRLFSSNVPVFPPCGRFRQARDHMNSRYHLPQYTQMDDPARPFFHTSPLLFENTGLLRSLAFRHVDEINVQYVTRNSQKGWETVLADHWLGLQEFLRACSWILGGNVPTPPEIEEKNRKPWSSLAPTAKDAKDAEAIGRKFLNHLLGVVASRIFLHITRRRTPSWDELLLANSNFSALLIRAPDGSQWSARQAVEELRHSFVSKFLPENHSGRVGAFVDPAVAHSRISDLIDAHIPLWFDFGSGSARRSPNPQDYPGRPPREFIPPPHAASQARLVHIHGANTSARCVVCSLNQPPSADYSSEPCL